MEKHQYICPKCGCQQYESELLQEKGGNYAKKNEIKKKYPDLNDDIVDSIADEYIEKIF